MNVTFLPLSESHFPLLLKWLGAVHVKKWWDQDMTYTPHLVKEKYGDCIEGYRAVNGVKKPIEAYIICLDGKPIGYIQAYNAYDFPRDQELTGLPESLAAFDIFIGEEEYLNKGIGSESIRKFTEEYIFPKYKYAFVDPEFKNEAAVRAYEKAGFKILKRVGNLFWMVAHKKVVRLPIDYSIALEVTFRECFLPNDRLWVFGSRADLSRKGGDIDLYVETHAKTVDEAVKREFKFIAKLERAIGEQKIDVVLNRLEACYSLPIYQVALTEGVRII